MAENRDQDQSRSSDLEQGSNNLQSGATDNRSSQGLGGQSQTSDAGDADYGAAGQPLDSGDSGRGGSTGTGNTDRSRSENLDSRPGEGGM